MTWKKWLIRGLICTFLLLLLAAGGVFALWTNPAAMRQMVAEQLAERFRDVNVQLAGARLRLLGGIQVRELRISRSQGIEKQDFLYVPSSVLYHDKEQILEGHVGLRKIELERPQIRIIRERNGSFNVSDILGPVNLNERIPTVTIRAGKLTFEDRAAGPGVPVLEVRDLELTLLNDPLPTLTIEGTGVVDISGPVRLRATVTRATMAVHLEIDQPDISVDAELWRRVGMLFPAAAAHLRHLTGKAEAFVKVDLPGESQAKAGHQVTFRLHEGHFRHPRLPIPVDGIEAEATLIDGAIPAAHATASSGPTRFGVDLKNLRLPAAPVEIDPDSLNQLLDELNVTVKQLNITKPILALLPPKLQTLDEDLSPSGPVSIRYEFRAGEKRASRQEWTFEPQGMSGSFIHFKYPLVDVRGRIVVDATPVSGNNIALDLTARSGFATATLKGTIEGEKKTSKVDLRIAARDVPLDDEFMRALPEKAQKASRQFLPAASREFGLAARPMGKADVVADIRRAKGAERFERFFVLNLREVSTLYDQFPYPLEDVSGVLEVHQDHWECKDFRGRHAGGEIAFRGRSYSGASAPGVRGALPVSRAGESSPPEMIRVSFAGKNLLLDEEFDRALRPIAGTGREGLQEAWRNLRLSGRLNFAAEVIDHTDRPQEIDIRVSMNGPAMKPKFFEYALEGVRAAVHYTHGRVELSDFGGTHGKTRVNLRSGLIEIGKGNGFTAWLDDVTASGLEADADLLKALPESLRRAVQPLKLETPVEVAVKKLILESPSGPSAPVKVWWEAFLGLDKARLRTAVEIGDATGQFFCEGHHDGHKLYGIASRLWLEKATVFGQPLTKIGFRLDIEHSSTDVVRIRDLRAELFGGTISGEARLETASALKYDINLQATGVQLDAFGKHNLGAAARAAQLQGPAHAAIHLTGQGQDLLGLEGNGRLDITQGKMGQLPVLLDLIKAFGLRKPDRTAFEQAHVIFAIKGPQLIVRQLELVGNAVSLEGSGKLDIDGNNIELDFTGTPGRFTQILPPGLDAIPPFLSGQILKIKMRGKFGKDGKVRFDKELMPGVFEPIKRVFESGT